MISVGPTLRSSHVTSGSEFGWRSGTGKWPAYYPDSLPAVGVGPGLALAPEGGPHRGLVHVEYHGIEETVDQSFQRQVDLAPNLE